MQGQLAAAAGVAGRKRSTRGARPPHAPSGALHMPRPSTPGLRRKTTLMLGHATHLPACPPAKPGQCPPARPPTNPPIPARPPTHQPTHSRLPARPPTLHLHGLLLGGAPPPPGAQSQPRHANCGRRAPGARRWAGRWCSALSTAVQQSARAPRACRRGRHQQGWRHPQGLAGCFCGFCLLVRQRCSRCAAATDTQSKQRSVPS